MSNTIPTPRDVRQRLETENTGLLDRAVEQIRTSKTTSSIQVKIQNASDTEVSLVMQQLRDRGWDVGRGVVQGAKLLLLSEAREDPQASGLRGTTFGQPASSGIGSATLFGLTGGGVAPASSAVHSEPNVDLQAEPAMRTTSGEIHTSATPPHRHDDAEVAKTIAGARSLEEAAQQLGTSPAVLQEHMRSTGLATPSTWGLAAAGAPRPDAQPAISSGNLRSAVTMAASPQVAARKLGIDELKLRELMAHHKIEAPRSWPTPPPVGTGG